MLNKIGKDESSLVADVHRLMVDNECEMAPVWQMTVYLSVSLVGPTKILTMSNNAGRPINTSLIGHSLRQNFSVSIHRPMIFQWLYRADSTR